jgi:hypothetical protein
MGRPHIARGTAADNNTQTWAHHVCIKKMSPAQGIKLSRGPGQRVKAFLFRWNVDLKNRSFETVDRKIFKQVSGSYLRFKASPTMFFDTLFCDTVTLKGLSHRRFHIYIYIFLYIFKLICSVGISLGSPYLREA